MPRPLSAEDAEAEARRGAGRVRGLQRPSAANLRLLVLGVLSVSAAAPLIKAISAPALVIAFWRLAFASLAVLPFALARHRSEIRRMTRSEARFAMVAGLFLGAHFAFFISSLTLTSVASAVSIVTIQPAWAALFARTQGEQIPAVAWGGIGLSLLGVLVLSGLDLTVSGEALLGDALALLGGLLGAAYRIVGAEVRQTVSTTAYTSVCYPTAAVVSLIVCGVAGEPVVGYDAITWLGLVVLAVLAQLLGHSVLSRALKTTSATMVSLALMFEVAGAVVLAWIFLGESPPVVAIPGLSLLVTGVMLVVHEADDQAAVPRAPVADRYCGDG